MRKARYPETVTAAMEQPVLHFKPRMKHLSQPLVRARR